MKNNLRIGLLLIALGLIFGAASAANAQEMKPPIVGGYGKVSADDRAVVQAANFAVKTEAKKSKAKIRLVRIKNAEQQVVAGMNFRVCLDVETNASGKKKTSEIAEAVVYKNLKQKYSLISWTKNACTAGM